MRASGEDQLQPDIEQGLEEIGKSDLWQADIPERVENEQSYSIKPDFQEDG